MNAGVGTALQFVLLAYVILFLMALLVAGMIMVVRRALAPRERAAVDPEKGKV
jgi:hypothetical protein